MSGSPRLIGTALTGALWRTYFASPQGELLTHVGAAPFALDGTPRVVAKYLTSADAYEAGRRALIRDMRFATEDMRVAFADIDSLLERCVGIEWVVPPADEGPVEPDAARASVSAALRLDG